MRADAPTDDRDGAALVEDPQELAERVVDMVGDRGEAQVRVTGSEHGLTRFANSFIHQHVGEVTTTVELKLAVEGRVLGASTTRADDDGLRDFVEEVVAAARVAPTDDEWPGVVEPREVPDLGHVDASTVQATPAERAEQVAAFVEAAPEFRAAGYLDTEHTRVGFANSRGHRAGGAATRATLDGIHQAEDAVGAAHRTSRSFADLDGAAVGRLAAERTRLGRRPKELEPGRYEVVLAPEAVATIAVFLGGYGFDAKQHQEDQSFVRLGEQQFDEQIGLRDDVTDPRGIALGFDSDGVPTSRVDLVERGRTVGLLHDRRTAARSGDGATTTGHATPNSEVWGPAPRALVVAPGRTTPESLLRSVERGLFVTTFNYCRILDPKTQVVTGLTRNGTFLVEDGRIVRAVDNLRFTQSFVEALAPGAVLGVGDDDRWADSEFGAGIVIAPSMRLASWNFTGGSRG